MNNDLKTHAVKKKVSEKFTKSTIWNRIGFAFADSMCLRKLIKS